MSSWVRQLFLRPSWGLVSVSVLLLATTVFVVKYAYLYMEWTALTRHQVAWQKTEAPRLCSEIASTCEAEAIAINPELRREHRVDPYRRLLELPGSPINSACKRRLNFESLACSTGDPQPFTEFLTWRFYRLDVEMIRFLATMFVPAFTFFAMRRFYGLNNIGWQRVTSALAILGSLVFACFVLSLEKNLSDDLWSLGAYGVAALLIGLMTAAAPSILRDTYKWFREGFVQQAQQQPVKAPDAQTAPGSEYLALDWSAIKPVLKYFAIALIIGLLVTFRPESSFKALVQALVQVAGIAIIWMVYKAFRRK